MNYFLGIDVGSTTLKTIFLDETNTILYNSYERHYSKPHEITLDKIKELKPLLSDKRMKVCITGSAGMGISELCDIHFVQEVFATTIATNELYPNTDVVIELGGEDAKIIFLSGGIEERMNGTCAGGTGAFIDQMASLMKISTAELNEVSKNHSKIYPIASRCGVFAKSDIQPLISQGARKEDIAASIFEAIVEQTISGLAHGRQIKGNVLFLGGPLHFLDSLREAFVKNLKLDEKTAIFPELGHYFVALGSAIYAKDNIDESLSYDELLNKLSKESETSDYKGEKPLFDNKKEYEDFKQRHSQNFIPTKNILGYAGKAYLGIDAGSTTIKIVLISEDNSLLYSFYGSNKGSPLDIIKAELEKIYDLCEGKISISASGVTGYGEELMCEAFGIDFGIVETMAHYKAASYFNKDVNFIIDIGGQDIKCFYIINGEIDSIVLNEACSSGCGSFLQAFANSIGHDIKDFAELAISSKAPSRLGSRCTVFMNSAVKQAQKEGASIEDISAGLAISVVKNALYKVIRVRSAKELGENIVVQGGTFLNDAVLRAFEKELDTNVIRLKNSELMGAYGAALFAKEQNLDKSALIDGSALKEFKFESKFAHCNRCSNKCSLNINIFNNKNKFISGNRCEKGAGKSINKELPNLVKFKQELINSYANTPASGKFCVGLPLVLNMYELLPFWSAFFRLLDCDIIVSNKPDANTKLNSAYSIPTDTVCYPAKTVHAHIEQLAQSKADMIFYPCMSYGIDEGISDNHYNCPVVAYYPELIKANVASLKDKVFLYPHIGLNNANFFNKRIFDILKPYIQNINLELLQNATNLGFKELKKYKDEVSKKAQDVLLYAQENDLDVVVLGSRPYHIDPDINKGVDLLLTSLGFGVLTEDSLPFRKYDTSILNQWSYHSRMINAAHFVTKHENMHFVQLVSFGCGIDAITTDEIKNILRSSGKFYTQLKIDEITNIGAMKIRLKSLKAMIVNSKLAVS